MIFIKCLNNHCFLSISNTHILTFSHKLPKTFFSDVQKHCEKQYITINFGKLKLMPATLVKRSI